MLLLLGSLKQGITVAFREDEQINIAEWSSPVARRAHNPKVVGSNPASATKLFNVPVSS